MADFHFLRPLWLLALPFGVLLILKLFRLQASGGGWRRVVDRSLQPLVLTADAYGGRLWPLAAALAAWSVATLALAGPAWERLPVPAFRSDEALVVALDLSRSMDAADLSPSRLARAKLKLLSLLEQRTSGQTGLVVFSAHAFTVTPLTTDTRTIGSLVHALTSDIMPSRGSYPESGLSRAAKFCWSRTRSRRRRASSSFASCARRASRRACSPSAPGKARRFRSATAAS